MVSISDVLHQHAEDEGGEWQRDTDPGRPVERAGNGRERGSALIQGPAQKLGALSDKGHGRCSLLALGRLPARELRSGAACVSAILVAENDAFGICALD